MQYLTYLQGVKVKDIGLLLLRIGIGTMFIFHGLPKIIGGVDKWANIGKAMETFGIYFLPEFWGFMASASEFLGGIFIILGVLFVPSNLLLFITMFVAASSHISRGDGFGDFSHSVEAAILFLSLLFIGPGKFTIKKIFKK